MSISSFFGGPPYPLNNAQIGGIPSVSIDMLPLAVFLALYAIAAVTSTLLTEIHRRKGHGRTIPVILFLFSGERVVACAMRIAWAFRPANVRIAVASQVLLQAGVLLLFLLNLILAERVLLDRDLGIRSRRCLKALLGTLSALTISALVMVVVSIIVSVYTLDQNTIDRCRDVQRAAATYLLALAAAPVAMLVFAPLLSSVPVSRSTGSGTPKLDA
ncbi:hypothetical protein J7T55_003154 [Diaporthe amygdali]|uniref:uncharacterized protein n=1 Tax=Phomopsis amygdali TaxID=1214568 RepID=UPI0022FE4C53|nr:uncharacterized protein J7T55_003154 [Diaporthe amygdali]KAJ0122639.1 hypothetical protein J7T55_003154 [Diaporthe amygdali]